MLRKVLSKFAAVDAKCSPRAFGVLYCGRVCRQLTAEESRYRVYIEDRTMRDEDARKILDELNIEEPFYTRLEWIRCVAAVANMFREEVGRMCPGPTGASGSLCAAQPQRRDLSGT